MTGDFGNHSIGNGGNGGTAQSTASATVTGAATANALATAGNGGAAGGVGKSAGLGGNATATASGSSSAGGNLIFHATAIGGNGGALLNSANLGANGGAATATATGSTSGVANVTAAATGGAGTNSSNLFGSALARATGSGSGGKSTATAASGGGIVTSVSSLASAPLPGMSVAESFANVGTAARSASLATGLQSATYATGLPLAADVSTILTGSAKSTTTFGPGSTALGLLTLGGAYTNSGTGGSLTFTSQANFTIAVATLQANDLKVALVDPVSSGAGFDSLRFRIQGVSTPVDQTFLTLDAADAYFTDDVLDFGPINPLGNALNVTFTFDLTAKTANDGFQANIVFGDSNLAPEPSALVLLFGGVAALGFLRPRQAAGLRRSAGPSGS